MAEKRGIFCSAVLFGGGGRLNAVYLVKLLLKLKVLLLQLIKLLVYGRKLLFKLTRYQDL